MEIPWGRFWQKSRNRLKETLIKCCFSTSNMDRVAPA